jgi:DNA polymerase-3 subunit delta
MIVILHGPDELALRRRMQELKDEADGGSGMLMSNLTTLEGRDVKAEEIIGPAMSVPFLGPKRLVVVEQFFDRFEPRGGEQRNETRANRALDAFASLFAALDSGLPPSTILVFSNATGVSTRNPMLERLKKIPDVITEESKKLEKDGLLRFIREEAAARSLRLKGGPSRRPLVPADEWLRPQESDPAALLAALHGADTLSIANELDKLALYTMGREATVDDVDLLCGGERERATFSFTDAVMDGDLKLAHAVLAHFWLTDVTPQMVIGSLIGAYRRLALVIDMVADGASAEEIGNATNQRWAGLRDKAIARARRLGPGGLKAAYAAIVAADRTTKLGEVKDDLAIEILVHKLSVLGRPSLR